MKQTTRPHEDCPDGQAINAQLPSRPQVDKGELIRDDSGKPKYFPIFEFDDPAAADRFSEAVCEAVEQHASAKDFV